MRWKFKAGQMLIEAMVAVVVISVGLMALVQLANRSISNSGVAKRQAQGTAYAQEGMEWIRKQRQLVVWGDFYAKISPSSYCINTLPVVNVYPDDWRNNLSVGDCGTQTIAGTEYSRKVTFTADASAATPQVIVRVDVYWTDTSGSETGITRTAHAVAETVFAKY